MVKYARLKMRKNDHGTIELTGDDSLDNIIDCDISNYKYVGSIDITTIDAIIEEMQPQVLYIDPITLSNLSIGFYRKYQKVIEEVLYIPNHLL